MLSNDTSAFAIGVRDLKLKPTQVARLTVSTQALVVDLQRHGRMLPLVPQHPQHHIEALLFEAAQRAHLHMVHASAGALGVHKRVTSWGDFLKSKGRLAASQAQKEADAKAAQVKARSQETLSAVLGRIELSMDDACRTLRLSGRPPLLHALVEAGVDKLGQRARLLNQVALLCHRATSARSAATRGSL